MRELDEAMTAPFRKVGAWNNAPIYHGLNPVVIGGEKSHIRPVNEVDVPGLRARFFPDLNGELPFKPVFNADLKLAPGMTLQLEPSGQTGGNRVFLGGSLLITENGNDEYSNTSKRLVVIKA